MNHYTDAYEALKELQILLIAYEKDQEYITDNYPSLAIPSIKGAIAVDENYRKVDPRSESAVILTVVGMIYRLTNSIDSAGIASVHISDTLKRELEITLDDFQYHSMVSVKWWISIVGKSITFLKSKVREEEKGGKGRNSESSERYLVHLTPDSGDMELLKPDNPSARATLGDIWPTDLVRLNS